MAITPYTLPTLTIPRVIGMLEDYMSVGDFCIPPADERRPALDAPPLAVWDALIGSGFDEDVATYAFLLHLARTVGIDVYAADLIYKTTLVERLLVTLRE